MASFTLSEKEKNQADKFIKLHRTHNDAAFEYTFHPTGIGDAVSIACNCGTSRNITDYDRW